MNVRELFGYELTCKMSIGLKNSPEYSKKEFQVVFKDDDDYESGYMATVSGYTDEEEFFSDDWDGKIIANHILFGDWDIISKKSI
ncbi:MULTISPECIES: hypothetical protein [unclassified Clostridium]|uniref:hypothetical protein n=1 Tax=unclassified Clostridium TaxID=2614128 RepID=UPI0002975342|nr:MULTISPECIES: hypothetical protein [unclassified Clostridium]EKQ57829.1 MAG: hypothetical protein A370_00473 [Clostridium sp. Maddingley MBC34-26]